MSRRTERIALSKHGSHFATRTSADKVLGTFMEAGESPVDSLDVDFLGVRVVSYSFADELVRKLTDLVKTKGIGDAHLSNCSDEVLKVIVATLDRRAKLYNRGLTVSRARGGIDIGLPRVSS